MIDADKAILELSVNELVKSMDFSAMLTVIHETNNLINGKPIAFHYETERFEYVNGHGNETGEFGERKVRKVVWDNNVWTEQELRLHLMEEEK